MVERLSEIKNRVPEALKNKLHLFRKQQKENDRAILRKTAETFEKLRQARDQNAPKLQTIEKPVGSEPVGKKKGFIVLGMHRSGTSMLSGLLVNGMGYNVGAPLIGAAADNEKGFFELLDAVLQNDEFMNKQRVWWSANVINYDDDKALAMYKSKEASFAHGEKALRFLNDANNAPWLQKDPRMCITLKTWLKLLNAEPAVVFTYRHPMEVARSLIKRESSFKLDHCLRLWIVYNMRAIQNMKGLCVVYSKNTEILANPMTEIQRISDTLTRQCGVPAPPRPLEQETVDKFVDPSLQHNTQNHDDVSCTIPALQTDAAPGTQQYVHEKQMYDIAMKIFCDLESKEAYKDDYEWPKLP